MEALNIRNKNYISQALLQLAPPLSPFGVHECELSVVSEEKKGEKNILIMSN
jgi:hypothetical protein